MVGTDLSEIIKNVRQPIFDDEMIKRLINGLNEGDWVTKEKDNYYNFIQGQNRAPGNSGEIDRDKEKELWEKKAPGYDQKGVFRHMGDTDDICYCISRLYVNCAKKDLMEFAQLFNDKCMEQSIPTYFKYSSDEDKRSDQLVIYSNLGDLEKYIQILRKIGEEHPDIIKRCGKPPILTGVIDDWIGIGDEPSTYESYTEIRSNVILNVLKKLAKKSINEETQIVEYSADGVDYDEIRKQLREAFEKIGIDIDTFSFNTSNLKLYMLDAEKRQQRDEMVKQKVIDNRNRILQKKETEDAFLEEQIPIQKLKILKQMGTKLDGMQDMISAVTCRYAFLLDVSRKKVDLSSAIQERFNAPQYVVDDNFEIKERNENGLNSISDDTKEQLGSQILEDVIQYYKNFFYDEQAVLKDSLSRYSKLYLMPTKIDTQMAEERLELYSRLKVLSQGKTFFEAIGIPSEQVELVCDRTKSVLMQLDEERSKIEKPEDEKWKREIDKEFLWIFFQESGITDKEELRRLYEEQDGLKVPQEDLEAVLEEFTNPAKINPAQIGEDTVKAKVGFSDIKQATQVLRRELSPEIENQQQQGISKN